MTDTTSISCNNPRDAKLTLNPTARLASNEKATILRDKQEQEQCSIHIPEYINCKDADINGTVPGFTDFNPELNNYEPTLTDLFSEEPPIGDYLKELSSEDLSSRLTTVIIEMFPRILPIPTSARGLYNNLLHVLRIRAPRPPLAALVDYHLLFPDCHSTRSYNLLISLSLHHRAYGITYTLFCKMQERSIQYNIETHRLLVRWLIDRGFWNKAWSYAMQLMKKFPDGGSQLPIWLEFCHSRKGPVIIRNAFNSRGKRKRRQKATESVSIISARRSLMTTHMPLSMPALEDTPPAGMRNIVQLMVKSRLRHQALKLTEDYFRALPLKMKARMNHRCLEIVKVHLLNDRKTGIPRFNAAKKLLFSLLSLNPSLRPTSDVLLLMLGILKKAKRCGTLAWKFISLCKEKWGPRLEDRRIQRHVSKLALKEGRMDIVETILRVEAKHNHYRRTSLFETKVVGSTVRPPSKILRRPSTRRIYPRNGRENYMWNRYCLRVRRTIKTRIARGREVPQSLRVLAQHPALKRNP